MTPKTCRASNTQLQGPWKGPALAGGPGRPELSKSYVDMASKLCTFTFTFTFTHGVLQENSFGHNPKICRKLCILAEMSEGCPAWSKWLRETNRHAPVPVRIVTSQHLPALAVPGVCCFLRVTRAYGIQMACYSSSALLILLPVLLLHPVLLRVEIFQLESTQFPWLRLPHMHNAEMSKRLPAKSICEGCTRADCTCSLHHLYHGRWADHRLHCISLC